MNWWRSTVRFLRDATIAVTSEICLRNDNSIATPALKYKVFEDMSIFAFPHVSTLWYQNHAPGLTQAKQVQVRFCCEFVCIVFFSILLGYAPGERPSVSEAEVKITAVATIISR